jgi:phage terminase small subunit
VVEGLPVGALEPPPGLSPVEAELWGYYMPRLTAIKILTELDRQALAHFCISAAQVQRIRTAQQQPRPRKTLDSSLRQWLTVTRLAGAELGLSPMSRARVAPSGPPQERDDLETFIAAPLQRVK